MKPLLFVADWGTFLALTYLIQKWCPNDNGQGWWLMGLLLANISATFRGRVGSSSYV